MPVPDADYVRELNEAYNHYFFHYTATPLLTVETSHVDLSWHEDTVADLERQIRMHGQGYAGLRPADRVAVVIGFVVQRDGSCELPALQRFWLGCWDSMGSCASNGWSCESVRLPLVRFFETSFGRIDDRTFLLVMVEENGATGCGECVADASPYYSSETTATAWHIISEFIAPILLGRSFSHPGEVFDALVAIRGHNMAKAAVEMAAWDLFARQRGVPLSAVLGGTRSHVESGVSIGIQATIDDLVGRIERSSPTAIGGSRSRSNRVGISSPSNGFARSSATCRSWSTPTRPIASRMRPSFDRSTHST